MKFRKPIFFLIAWYMISFYANIICSMESYRAEHMLAANANHIEYAGIN